MSTQGCPVGGQDKYRGLPIQAGLVWPAQVPRPFILTPFLGTSVPGALYTAETLPSWSPCSSGGRGANPRAAGMRQSDGRATDGPAGSWGHSLGPEWGRPGPQSSSCRGWFLPVPRQPHRPGEPPEPPLGDVSLRPGTARSGFGFTLREGCLQPTCRSASEAPRVEQHPAETSARARPSPCPLCTSGDPGRNENGAPLFTNWGK